MPNNDSTRPENGAPPILGDLPPASRQLSRRAFLSGAASGAAVLGLGALWSRSAMAATTPASQTLRARPNLLTLVNRLTSGYTESEYQSALTQGYAGYLQSTLYPGVLDDSVFEDLIASYDANGVLGLDPLAFAGKPTLQAQAIKKVANKAFYSSLLSVYQTRERLIEFWRDHFNVYPLKPGVESALTQWDREIVRPHATGKFADLLMAVEKHLAMLVFLDNQHNKWPVVNENLGREILELHTVAPADPLTGVVNYGESDVVEFAKCISGWNSNSGTFQFSDGDHAPGNKDVMGLNVPENFAGPSEGEEVLDTLSTPYYPIDPVRYPIVTKTATFIAYKLCRWFLDYQPAPAVVQQARDVYLNTGGDIRAMVASILAEPNVQAVSSVPDLKFRRPSQWLVAMLRALQLTASEFDPSQEQLVKGYLHNQGNAAYDWPAPNGFPDDEGTWATAVFGRWELGADLFLSTSPISEVTITDAHLDALAGSSLTVSELVARIDVVITGGVLTDFEKMVLEGYSSYALGTLGLSPGQVQREAFLLATLSPTAMYY